MWCTIGRPTNPVICAPDIPSDWDGKEAGVVGGERTVLHSVSYGKSPHWSLYIALMLTNQLQAGICARSEKHRRLAREQLANVSESKLWLMRGVDFIPVLDHLWHGAAANGQPIKWSDYMQSRETMLPIIT